MECPSSQGKFVPYKKIDRIKNYHQQKKVVGAAHFSFQICRYKKEMTMPHDLQLF